MSTADQLRQGWRVHQAGDHAAAERFYLEVLNAEPQNAIAWCYLGILRHDQKRYDDAEAAYRRALALHPQFPVAYNNLGNTLNAMDRREEALACFDQALAIQPDYANAWKNKGAALTWLGRLDEAVACFRRALTLAPNDPQTHRDLGVVYLLQGRYREGWPEYEWRWQSPQMTLPSLRQPKWDGGSLDGKTLFLLAEQGLGDTVHFIRYAARLKQRYDCRIIVACHKPLMALVSTAPGVDAVIPHNAEPNEYDVYAPLLSVPGILGEGPGSFPADIPYLHATPERVAYWRQELACYGGLRVGIVWQGNPGFEADRMRSASLTAFGPLGQLKGITLFSLQKGVGEEQLEQLGGRFDVVPLGRRLDVQGPPFADTAAVLQSLDLVIAVDTVIGHLAGALGRPVWLALAHVPDWRWGMRGDRTEWYPTMRLFRQTRRADWSTVFEPMAQALLHEYAPRVARRSPEDYHLAASGVNRLGRTRHGLLLYNPHDLSAGQFLDRYGEYCQAETELFRQVVQHGWTVVEAGAHIGMHTVLFSERVGPSGKVYAFEPHRLAFQALCGNLALQSCTNVDCRRMALDEQTGRLFAPLLDPTQEAAFAEITLQDEPPGEEVPTVSLDSLELPACHFLRIAAAGREAAVLRGARNTIERYQPVLYVSNQRSENSQELIALLQSLGYNLYWHTPLLYHPQNFFGNPKNAHPGVVSVNMLGVPVSVRADIQGLRPVTGPDSDWRKPYRENKPASQTEPPA